MKWAHLPVAGGLYDQHPRFVEHMTFILHKEAEAEAADAKKAKEQSKTRPKKR